MGSRHTEGGKGLLKGNSRALSSLPSLISSSHVQTLAPHPSWLQTVCFKGKGCGHQCHYFPSKITMTFYLWLPSVIGVCDHVWDWLLANSLWCRKMLMIYYWVGKTLNQKLNIQHVPILLKYILTHICKRIKENTPKCWPLSLDLWKSYFFLCTFLIFPNFLEWSYMEGVQSSDSGI